MGKVPVLVIHIGSPKTGTTAIQGFLKTNATPLEKAGLRFIRAGRTNISHNSLVQPLLRGRAEDTLDAIRRELVDAHAGTAVLSSEMFFQPAAAPVLAEAFSGLDREISIVGYLRRPDAYAEAMYKQKVKNGRIAPDPVAFLESWRRHLRYGPVVEAYRAAFGAEALRIRPFRRSLFPEGDVVRDFLATCGVEHGDEFSSPDAPSNRSLSRAVSEALGRVNRHTPFNTRVMIREIAAAADPDTIRSGDVFDIAIRREIVASCADDLAEVGTICWPDLAEPFDMSDLAEGAEDPFPDAAETIRLERAAAEAVTAAIGRQSVAAQDD